MDLGLAGAAVAWNAVQLTSLGLLTAYVARHTHLQDPARRTWPGWSLEAWRDWGVYVRVAAPSIVMICACLQQAFGASAQSAQQGLPVCHMHACAVAELVVDDVA